MAHMVLKGRHRLYVADLGDFGYLDWLNSLTTSLEELWVLALDTSMELEALEPAKYGVVVCEDAAQCGDRAHLVLRVEEAERLIREPFRVYVENDDADRDFLLTFANAEQFRKISELEYENFLSFEHCGGITELPKKVAKYVQKHPTNHLNCSAIFDSDAPAPGMVSHHASSAKMNCDNIGISSHILQRRAIENYLMRGWLETWVNRSTRSSRSQKLEVFKCFCKLTLEQRSHYHMKNGLKADQAQINNGTVTLYAGLSASDIVTLNDGFGTSLAADLYAEEWVKNTQSVDDVDAWKEVNGIVKEILVLCR